MAQPEIHAGEENGGNPTQSIASGESWLSQVKRTFDSTHKMWQVSEKVCIYRVVEPIRISKPQAYDPLVISFGPYHHKNNPKFSMMDQYKLEAVHKMLARLKTDVTSLIAKIQKLEREIRECYAERIEWDGETLSWMLAMDACFILEFFRDRNRDRFSLVFQPHSPNSIIHAIVHDIMKLENQIPLFILIEILQLECQTREHAIRELDAMLSNYVVFRGFPFPFSWDDESKLEEYMMNERPPCHLLDLSRMVIRDLIKNSSAKPDGCGGTDNINNDHGEYEWSMNVAQPEKRPFLPPTLSSCNAPRLFVCDRCCSHDSYDNPSTDDSPLVHVFSFETL